MTWSFKLVICQQNDAPWWTHPWRKKMYKLVKLDKYLIGLGLTNSKQWQNIRLSNLFVILCYETSSSSPTGTCDVRGAEAAGSECLSFCLMTNCQLSPVISPSPSLIRPFSPPQALVTDTIRITLGSFLFTVLSPHFTWQDMNAVSSYSLFLSDTLYLWLLTNHFLWRPVLD